MFQDPHCRICGELKVKTVRTFHTPTEYSDAVVSIYDYPDTCNQSDYIKLLDIFCPNCYIQYKVG